MPVGGSGEAARTGDRRRHRYLQSSAARLVAGRDLSPAMLDVARGKFGPEEEVACQIADRGHRRL